MSLSSYSVGVSSWKTLLCGAIVGGAISIVSEHLIYQIVTSKWIKKIFPFFFDWIHFSNTSALETESIPTKSDDTEVFGEYGENQRSDVPENAPESCPGVYSEEAGRSATCDGCPNQPLCQSGEARQPDPGISEVLQQLHSIKHKILVLSGKGGVGKSTVASQLSWILQTRGFEIGLLDIDICGPSIPRMTGVLGRDVHLSANGWTPIYVEPNFAVMSIGFLLPDDDAAVIWRGPKKNALIRQFLTDVLWGEMDFLIVDTPPGTSDEHLSIVTFLKETGIDGAVIVTTPQEISLQDVRKEINFCKRVGIRILGVVENMNSSVFKSTTGGAEKMANNMNVPYIGSIPLDDAFLQAGEQGKCVLEINGRSESAKEMIKAVDFVLKSVNEPLYSGKTTEESQQINGSHFFDEGC